ncbi:MAG: enoyl-CoA hydratase/isomerase family protein [Desulfomonilaceae bacterium]
MEYQDITLTKAGRIATITIDRPKVLNAIRYRTMLEIDHALDVVESDSSVRVLVITGAGEKAFVSGGDISIMARGAGYIETLTEVPHGQEIGCRIEGFSKPTIARINGVALGGGAELALCCDIRIAVDAAILGLPEIKLGIIPGYGGTQRLPRLIPVGLAKELILLGEALSAQEALRIGLLNRVVPRNELDAAVQEVADKLAAKSPVALHMAKVAIDQGLQADLRTGLQIEARCFSLCFGTEDRIEGMKAFLEKREAAFKGR